MVIAGKFLVCEQANLYVKIFHLLSFYQELFKCF